MASGFGRARPSAGRRDRPEDVSTARSGVGESGMRLALFLLLCACGAAQEPAEILGRIRHNVQAQVSRSANYSCVETVERDYFLLPPAAGGACSGAPAGA